MSLHYIKKSPITYEVFSELKHSLSNKGKTPALGEGHTTWLHYVDRIRNYYLEKEEAPCPV